MDPLAVLAYGTEQAQPLIGMEWNGAMNDQFKKESGMTH